MVDIEIVNIKKSGKFKKVKQYFWNLFIAVDQLGNALLLGDPDETISSRLGKYVRAGTENKFLIFVAMILDKIDPGHCRASIEEDEGKDAVVKIKVK